MMDAFDKFADAIDHLAAAMLDLAVPVLLAWGLWLMRTYLPRPPGNDGHPTDTSVGKPGNGQDGPRRRQDAAGREGPP